MVKEGDDKARAAAASGVSEQGDHQEALQRRFHGRAKLLAEAVEKVRDAQAKGGVLLVHGAAGEGKTVFMASLSTLFLVLLQVPIPRVKILMWNPLV